MVAVRQIKEAPNPKAKDLHRFMFSTGIEGSYPISKGKDGNRLRFDQMELTHHYQRFKEDYGLVRDLDIEFLRFGPPYYQTHSGPGRYDWAFADDAFAELKRLGITPIVDLCHFGVPDWIGDFQNRDWPKYFAEYAGAFARRYPWLRFYTPVNEIFVAASFSALLGWWNEMLTSDKAFVNAIANMCRATLLAQRAILEVQPRAVFVQSESTEYFHPAKPDAVPRAKFLNERRFLSLDLVYGYDVRGCMLEYLLDYGMTREEYHWFLDEGNELKKHCVMGNDYYASNEHLVQVDGLPGAAGEIFGYYVLTKQYFDRYHLPVMHTETNLPDAERAPGWLWKEWHNMVRLKQDGVPIIGFTWYSLIDQIDWDIALTELRGTINQLGLYDLDRKVRPVGTAYRELVREWREILPIDSLCFGAEVSMQPGGMAT